MSTLHAVRFVPRFGDFLSFYRSKLFVFVRVWFALGVVLLVFRGFAFAQATPPANLAALASSVDLASVTSALLTVAAAIVTVLVAWAGIKFVLRAVKHA